MKLRRVDSSFDLSTSFRAVATLTQRRNGRIGMIRQILALCIAALPFPAMAAPAAYLRLWRLDCGTIQVSDLNECSATFAYTGQTKRLIGSCYLIKHGDTYMLWDTGLPEADLGLPLQGPGSTGDSLSRTILDQLAEINVSPTSVSILGISLYHYDHTGQAASFPQSKLYRARGYRSIA